MIQIENKQDCCGCNACVQRCPKQCISMIEDKEGFLYPQVDVDSCVNCGLCDKVCPVIHQNPVRQPLGVYAGINPNEIIRMQSSSGGIFTMIAEQIIDEGGVVFGVKYNEHWEAVHDYALTKQDLVAFRTSKYIQSIVGKTYKEAESFLRQGKKVLYSGTPCQIAGLKKFLRRNYENLLTIDFICHGTPSPGVFRWYLSEELTRIACMKNKRKMFALQNIPEIPKIDLLAKEYNLEIKGIRFRDKRKGWRKYSFVLDVAKLSVFGKKKMISLSQTFDMHVFLRGFLKDLYLRPSCYACPAKQLKSGADITIGDWWGIQKIKPEIDDDKGISAIIVNSNSGVRQIQKLNINVHEVEYADLCQNNSALLRSAVIPTTRDTFYAVDGNSFFEKINEICRISAKDRFKKKIKLFLGFFKMKYK